MSMTAPKDTPVWVDEHRCKACNICVSYCPAGVLAMRDDVHAVLGQMIEVVHP
ncbi:2-oxoglutarate:acceptor oxidoreductase, partial [Campylobacter jejuni]|nr:2-oxoglutarate:acceptor oxidoreductase [Campylobacter jejuni]HED7181153.1 4Fe-4S binding protein [Campylobacter jejuni]HED9019430.1 4Fe-4S binding protein [Campylobacter jejuni]HEG3963651.1 4Fe-4S binding protein [Campylobacter jejuni]HEG5354046.1 4Fe-4S binding protein [Campylobacter jejuni]